MQIGCPAVEGERRFSPRIWQHDWHHLRSLRKGLERAVGRLIDGVPQGATILDYGAGDAPYASLFRSRPDVHYVTCDLAGSVDVKLMDDGRLPVGDHSARALVSFQVLEHVPDTDLYLAECRRALEPGGSLLLSTHGAWLYHPHPTDYRRWTRDGLRLELENAGFAVNRLEGIVGPLAWTTQFRLLGYWTFLRRIAVLGKPLAGMMCMAMNARILVEEAITPDSIRQENACVYIASATLR